MSTVLLNGNPIGVGGHFPRPGDVAHSFMLVDQELKDISLSQFSGKRKVVVVVPSLDATIGIKIARQMEGVAETLADTISLIISVDTPFAQARIAAAEDFRHIRLLSTLRGRDFHKDYGVMITDVPLSGMMATAVVVADENDVILHAELVNEINNEPNYQKIVDALKPKD